ncbi:hypothetical protein OIO90_005045 [Microbotryomycetes sp. JL221]|nr:hypothetical protein OIO90_005045 [Microbotryomycetes sp. JL221]
MLTSSFVLTITGLALAASPLVVASGVAGQHQGALAGSSHLAARNLRLSPHASFQRLHRRSRSSKLDRPRRLSKRGGANEATLKCLTAYTFALCDGDACTDMGSVAAGTMCKDNAITWDTGAESSNDDSSASSTVQQVQAEAENGVAPGQAAAAVTVKQLNVQLAASTTTSSAPAAETTWSDSGDDDEEWVCDDEEEDDNHNGEEAWTDDSSSAGQATASPTVAENWVQTTTTAAPATTTTSSSGGGGESFSGKATFYYQMGAFGSCGNQNPDSAFIVAMNAPMAGNNAHCGQKVHITNTANGQSVDATVADLCPGCGWGDLDLSVAAFNAIGSPETGVLPITWTFTS